MDKEKLLEVLKKIKPDVDFAKETGFITNKILDSVDMMEFISDLEEVFSIEISMEYMDAAHFDSVDAILATIEELC